LNIERISASIGRIVGEESLKINEPMKNHTSFKVGGIADILALPSSPEQLTDILILCKAEGVPAFVMGNGTNLIVRDKGIRGVVIKTFNNLCGYTVKDHVIEAESGLLLSKVSNIALDNGLSGLEFASGIPGTLGGAVTMNAGAYNGEMKDVVIRTEYIDRDMERKALEGGAHLFGYRTSFIQKEGGIVYKSFLKLRKGSKGQIKSLMNELNKRRKETQPLEFPSAGSIFKRPPGFYTGKLIDECGLRGYGIGGAKVSEKHCGFIINSGNATASDIIELIRHIQNVVKLRFGVELSTEVKIVGEE
jgi:UDP-N-acetylmuramate dehydrogenase